MSFKFSNDEMKEKALHGTTTIGIVCKNSVVFATDTRAVMGYSVAHKNVRKVYPIEKHLAITIAGGVADAQRVVDRANEMALEAAEQIENDDEGEAHK